MDYLRGRKFKTKKHGWPARIICTDRKFYNTNCPIVVLIMTHGTVEEAHYYTEDLKALTGTTYDDGMELVEVIHYPNFSIDAPVVCWDNQEDSVPEVFAGHYAGVSPYGLPMVFPDGKTSYTNQGREPKEWDNCISLEEYEHGKQLC